MSKEKIIIQLRGGVIQHITASTDLDIHIIDLDELNYFSSKEAFQQFKESIEKETAADTITSGQFFDEDLKSIIYDLYKEKFKNG